MSEQRIGLFSGEGKFVASQALKLLQAFRMRHRTGARTGMDFSQIDRGASGCGLWVVGWVEVSDSGTG